MVKKCLNLWHKTTYDRAEKILSEGFRLRKRGTGARGGKTDIRGISFGTGKYAFSSDMIAYDLGVDKSDIVKIEAEACLNVYNAKKYGGHSRKKLMKQGYDAIIYPSDEVVVFKPKKVKIKTRVLPIRW